MRAGLRPRFFVSADEAYIIGRIFHVCYYETLQIAR